MSWAEVRDTTAVLTEVKRLLSGMTASVRRTRRRRTEWEIRMTRAVHLRTLPKHRCTVPTPLLRRERVANRGPPSQQPLSPWRATAPDVVPSPTVGDEEMVSGWHPPT
jgi:hypothetical protein